MIKANAIRIQTAWIRPCADEFLRAVTRISATRSSSGRTVRHGKRVQHRLESCRSRLPQGNARQEKWPRFLRLEQTQPFIGEEKKCLVSPVVNARDFDWPPRRAPKIIL